MAAAVLWPAFAGVEPAGAAGARDGPIGGAFDVAAIPRLVGEDKTVFVDVSAAWCLTCKVNEAAVLDRAPVARRLFGPDVVAMRGDWTRPDPSLTRYLQSFGRYGIPFNAVYGPGRPERRSAARAVDLRRGGDSARPRRRARDRIALSWTIAWGDTARYCRRPPFDTI